MVEIVTLNLKLRRKLSLAMNCKICKNKTLTSGFLFRIAGPFSYFEFV